MDHNFKEKTEQAAQVLSNVVEKTPLTPSINLGQAIDGTVYMKQENLQLTNCCKARSAYFMLSILSPHARRHVVTVSTGNNGISMSWAMKQLGIPGTVFLPHTVVPHKVAAISQNPVQIIREGEDIVDAEIIAREYAAEHDYTFRSPYNEWGAMYAQATIAHEVLGQLDELGNDMDAIIVPVGGGGLIGGIAGYLRTVKPNVEIIGVQPANSAVMALSVREGRILEMPSLPTLSDATAGGVEQGCVTFEFCRDYVDDYILVSEDEIGHAMVLLDEYHGIAVEGSGALSVAALLQKAEHFQGKKVALLLCGANVDASLLTQLRAA